MKPSRCKHFSSKSSEIAAFKLAAILSTILETVIDPYSLHLFPAIGYWSHVEQDVQKFTGHFNSGGIIFTIGSWELTLSQVANRKFVLHDNRGNKNAYSDFELTFC